MVNLKHLLAGLMCVCMSSFATAQDEPSLSSASSRDLTVAVQITGNTELKGSITGLSELKLQTKFGQVTIPLGEIEGAKMHADEKDSCVVAFKNGDIVTGAVTLDKISIATAWGDANIRIENIETVLVNQKGSFFKDSAQGKTYWRFSETRAVAPPSRRSTAGAGTSRQNFPGRSVQNPGIRPTGPGR